MAIESPKCTQPSSLFDKGNGALKAWIIPAVFIDASSPMIIILILIFLLHGKSATVLKQSQNK